MNFRVFDSVRELAESAADHVVRLAESSEGRVAISLSGGSTPRELYALLGAGNRRESLAQREIVWITGDERCVPPDDTESNARMIRETLFAQGVPPKHHFLRFRTELQDARATAAVFDEEWRALRIARLDLALLGIGEDGHTASLFPGTEILDIDDRVAAAVWVERLRAWRVSLTVPVIGGAAAKVVMAAGEGKRAVIDRVRGGEDLPVTRVCGAGPECWWLVDREAYGPS